MALVGWWANITIIFFILFSFITFRRIVHVFLDLRTVVPTLA